MTKEENFIAHSKLIDVAKNINIASQPYFSHIKGVFNYCDASIARIKRFINPEMFPVFKKAILLAAIYHDLGKLDEQAQFILNGLGKKDEKMINHVDAGVAYLLLLYENSKDIVYLIAAYLVLAHHIGLPNYTKMFKTESKLLDLFLHPTKYFRDNKSLEKYGMGQSWVKNHVDEKLEKYLTIHNSLCKLSVDDCEKTTKKQCLFFMSSPMALKVAISILVDADHADTSVNYGDTYPIRIKHLNHKDYISNLNDFIEDKKKAYLSGSLKCSKERFSIRQDFFKTCQLTETDESFYLVDGTVGVGKTFGIMSLGLNLAQRYNLDTIIFMLPYISLIDQSADEYIKGIFKDEDAARYNLNVIHSVFKSKNVFHRRYCKGFNAPINITTSVNFFDIISSNHSCIFKHLHKFVGSVIVIDEYHAAASYEFWPTMLKMMKELATVFSCKFVFSSGTPVEYWDIDEISRNFKIDISVKKVIDDNLYDKMIEMEKNRVKIISTVGVQWDFDELGKNVLAQSNSVFVILNTRKKTVAFVKSLSEKTNRKIFLRFSGMAPKHRKLQLEQIKESLNGGEPTIVVATQGSDIGLDLSFFCGFKESSNYDSIAQMKGRINRGCEFENSFLHIFTLSKTPNNDGEIFYDNPSFQYKKNIFESEKELHNSISSEYSTYIAKKEVTAMPKSAHEKMRMLYKLWSEKSFEDFSEEFSLISMPMIHILIDKNIFSKMKKGEYVPYADLQNNVVSMIYSDKNMDLLKGLLISVDSELIKTKDDEENDEDSKSMQSKTSNLFFWKGVYDSEKFGIFADPVFGLVDLKTLIV